MKNNSTTVGLLLIPLLYLYLWWQQVRPMLLSPQLLWQCQQWLQQLNLVQLIQWLLLLSFIWAVIRQILSGITYRLKQQVWVQQAISLPEKLRPLLTQTGLTPEQIILLPTPSVQAYTIGYWHPKIVITQAVLGQLSDAQLSAVLHHEACHVKHRHPLKLMMINFVINCL